jgi:hypothetical protein
MIPFFISSFFNEDILLYAPRILNERTCWRSSRFKKTEALTFLDNRLLNSNGVILVKPFNFLAALSTPFKEGWLMIKQFFSLMS